jgi:ABC-type multidrug transport system ATPase subunit
MKQIIHNVSGYAKPREMIAMMGPSGSGKTSLLNVLAQRFGLSPGSKLYGSVKANNRDIHQNDFGKFGAFVQQDDILIETMSAREAFTFAAKLRTTLKEQDLEKTVDRLLERLGLTHVQHTRIGSERLKGLSGGERKRTSIGYELITNPRLVLLDEPTSGLDSTTALKIMKMIKKEANAGLTIICTIHQPSSDLFRLMDRVIVLVDGF